MDYHKLYMKYKFKYYKYTGGVFNGENLSEKYQDYFNILGTYRYANSEDLNNNLLDEFINAFVNIYSSISNDDPKMLYHNKLINEIGNQFKTQLDIERRDLTTGYLSIGLRYEIYIFIDILLNRIGWKYNNQSKKIEKK